jgi:uncharacterized damage-inducible protein DinB
MMKDVLIPMADYNAKAMDAALAAIAKAPAGLAAKDVGAYFKSLDGIVEHMAWAQVLWLKRFAGFGSFPSLASSELVARPLDDTKREVTGKPAAAAALLRESAALLARFVAELPEAELGRRVRYTTTDGKELERTFWHAVFQVLNHGTHHRGEISVILDMNGAANDFNSFVSYVP